MFEDSIYVKALNERLAQGHTVRVFVDVTDTGVVMPAEARQCHPNIVAIDVMYNAPVPIRDLCVDNESISGTFSFNRVPRLVIIPWSAVIQMFDMAEHPGVDKPAPAQPKKPLRQLAKPAWFGGVIKGGKA